MNGAAQPNPVNPQTNQLSSAIYDPNGNMVSGAGATLTYNVDNRMISATETSGGVEYDEYAPDGKRIFRQLADGSQEFMLYGIQGELLGTFTVSNYLPYPQDMNVHFAGKLIWHGNTDNGPPYGSAAPGAVLTDRLGTNRNGMRFYPYGDEITSSANDQMKFATYIRDSYTGLDYADQRFYASTYGRFLTADPWAAGGAEQGSVNNPRDPGSWNRYAYTRGDPVNRLDVRGTCDAPPDTATNVTVCDDSDGVDPITLMMFTGYSSAQQLMTNLAAYASTLAANAAQAEWNSLSVPCQLGLQTAVPNTPVSGMLGALNNALAAQSTLANAVSGTAISWTMLAAIGIRESGFQNNPQASGPAIGVFQIDPTQNPGTQQTASGLASAANWAATTLNGNTNNLAANFPNLSSMSLAGFSGYGDMSIIALADTYNLGLGGVKQFLNNGLDPDLGTTGENYGQNIYQLIQCFH